MTKGISLHSVRASLCVALCLMPLFGLHAQLDWAGGDADWASDNWKDADGNPVTGWPGDPDNIGVRANLAEPGTVFIRAGDLIQAGDTWMYATGPSVVQTGGTYYANNRIYMFDSNWEMTGGLVGGSSEVRFYDGSVFTLYDGKLGDRDENSAHNFGIRFHSGTGILNINGGMLRPHSLEMNNGATNARVRVFGAEADILTIAGSVLETSAAGNRSTVEFIFSEDGISTWACSGGSAITLNLGAGDTAAHLEVDVSAYLSGGTVPFTLFDFAVNKLSGAFASVTVYDDTLGFLSPGTPGDLELGEYALVYADTTEGKILLYYHNNPDADQSEVYVSTDGGHVFPYATWATAATNVSDAVNHANSLAGATVWISNGTYVVTEEITILGTQVRGYGGDRTAVIIDGNNAVRPFYLGATDAVLADLTVANGYAGTDDRNGNG